MNQINSQFTGHGVLVKQGAISIVDASVTPTLRKPKGKSSYTLAEGQEPPLDKTRQPGVDQEARWVKKGGKPHYGYKRHYLSDQQTELVLSVHTTSANVHVGQCMAACLDQVDLPIGSRLLADKGYCSAKNEQLLRHGVVLERDDSTILGNWPPWLIFLPRSFKHSLALSPMVIVPCTSK